MNVRFYIDPESGKPHLFRHGVREQEAEDVLRRPLEDRPGHEGARVAIGQTRTGDTFELSTCLTRARQSVLHHRVRSASQSFTRVASPTQKEFMSESRFPNGWDAARVERVLRHYEDQTDEEAVAEDEAACEAPTHTLMEVPVDLVPAVRELIAKRRAS